MFQTSGSPFPQEPSTVKMSASVWEHGRRPKRHMKHDVCSPSTPTHNTNSLQMPCRASLLCARGWLPPARARRKSPKRLEANHKSVLRRLRSRVPCLGPQGHGRPRGEEASLLLMSRVFYSHVEVCVALPYGSEPWITCHCEERHRRIRAMVAVTAQSPVCSNPADLQAR